MESQLEIPLIFQDHFNQSFSAGLYIFREELLVVPTAMREISLSQNTSSQGEEKVLIPDTLNFHIQRTLAVREHSNMQFFPCPCSVKGYSPAKA